MSNIVKNLCKKNNLKFAKNLKSSGEFKHILSHQRIFAKFDYCWIPDYEGDLVKVFEETSEEEAFSASTNGLNFSDNLYTIIKGSGLNYFPYQFIYSLPFYLCRC